MSREAVDHALATLHDERERISASLLDLENHHGHRLLKGARLTGGTRDSWERAQAALTFLWRLFDAYQNVCQDVLDKAAGLGRRRPNEATLRELTDLLTGPSVESPHGEIPLRRRTLLGPARERYTLDEAKERMTAAYQEVIELVSAVDAAWEALLGPLDAAEEEWRETVRLAQSLGEGRNAELDRIGRELAAAGQTVRTDPLALVRDGRADPGRIETLREDLAAVRGSLAEAARLRAGYDGRVAALEAGLGALAQAVADARSAHRTVQVKIADPGVPEPADPVPVLRERLDSLAALRAAGRWPDLAARLAELEAGVAGAREQAERARALSAGLLERRDELRGRLDAYRVKAARLGFAEHDELARLQERARALLWTAPCDLRQATVVLAEYQRVLRSLETGTD
ncbi:hypothetical protein [Thermomonospora cellulosilytica]|uniref:Uncharacterized protein n=1 Tax=Thermomonospora cellulosilytica TaxID=1411118 RepID=A0A7W3MUY2_9ACTN|nr:hypothetical protein [Thermomonospora cellulosilytica]MBA9002397.1 hypothetical protein [Thermomonospora cellulosilytica]